MKVVIDFSGVPTTDEIPRLKPPRVVARQLREKGEEFKLLFEQMSRAPFSGFLARVMAAEPTDQALKKFADKTPDRWGQLAAIFARLSGYSDKIEIDQRSVAAIMNLSDHELEQRLRELEQTNTIEVEPQAVKTD